MKLILEIPEEPEVSLAAKAEDLGMPLPELALNLLGARGGPLSAEEVKTGADLVRYWREHGVIGMLPPDTDPVALSLDPRAGANSEQRLTGGRLVPLAGRASVRARSRPHAPHPECGKCLASA